MHSDEADLHYMKIFVDVALVILTIVFAGSVTIVIQQKTEAELEARREAEAMDGLPDLGIALPKLITPSRPPKGEQSFHGLRTRRGH